jgi:hypothetical protein
VLHRNYEQFFAERNWLSGSLKRARVAVLTELNMPKSVTAIALTRDNQEGSLETDMRWYQIHGSFRRRSAQEEKAACFPDGSSSVEVGVYLGRSLAPVYILISASKALAYSWSLLRERRE